MCNYLLQLHQSNYLRGSGASGRGLCDPLTLVMSRAGMAQRHLSFLEMRRAFPSRDMVVRLVATLDLPLRQHNELRFRFGLARNQARLTGASASA